jgi:DNA-binding transcriptional ArsR family regulator
MPAGDSVDDPNRLAPDEAFAVLGDETRMGILRALGDLESPVPFSDLYDRSGADDSGAFNYHLDRMVGHFVERTDDGYRLAPAGRRVVESVLSGAVTEHPDLSRTEVDQRCPYCGATVAVQWEHGGVEQFCTECAGRYGRRYREGGTVADPVEGYLGRHPLPPAGVRDRDADELLGAAWTWGNLEVLSLASGVCPRCAGTVEWETNVCESHDAGDGLCPSCEGRYAAGVTAACTNCILLTGGDPVVALAANTDLLALLVRNGHNPVDPDAIHRVEAVHGEYEETVHATDPFRATYTFTLDGDSLALTVDGDLAVVETAWGTVD